MEDMFAGAVNHLDEPTGHPWGIGLGFFGICLFMILVFLGMIWVGKMREKRSGPREAPPLPYLIKKDEERERRRQSGR